MLNVDLLEAERNEIFHLLGGEGVYLGKQADGLAQNGGLLHGSSASAGG
jgi:hypothetical protein